MADNKMNQFPTATDANYIYAETVDGNQIRIDVTSLRAVLFKTPTYQGDLNGLILAGARYEIYKLTALCTNVPTSGNGAFCLVISYDGWVIHQVFIGGSGRMWCRTCFGTDKWEDWRVGGKV